MEVDEKSAARDTSANKVCTQNIQIYNNNLYETISGKFRLIIYFNDFTSVNELTVISVNLRL